MNCKSLFFFFTVCFIATRSYGQCPPNIDFETGSLSFWNFFNGTVASGPVYTLSPSAPVPGREDLTTSGTDPYGFFPVVGAGLHSCKLGHDTILYCAERAQYQIHVPTGATAYSLIYRYAMVLENPGHAPADQPRFVVNAYDSATGAAIPCAQANYVSSSTLPGFILSTVGYDVYYRDWSTASMNLSGYGGRTCTIEFTAADCAAGGHFGYGYFDMSCGLFAISTNACNATTVTLSAPYGYRTYAWYDSTTFTTLYGSTDTVTIPVPGTATTYAVILTPYTGYGCTDTLYTRVVPTHLVTNPSNDTTVCVGSSISLTSNATDISLPLTYLWTSSGGTISCSTCDPVTVTPVSGANTFLVTVTDAAGCSETDTIHVLANGVVPTLTPTNVSCYGRSDGSITAVPTSGTPPFTYSWSTSPVQTTSRATGLVAGSYTVNITDATGCTSRTSISVTQPPPTVISIVASSNPTTCSGSDGTITIGGLVPSTMFTVRFRVNTIPQTRNLLASGTGTVVLIGLASGTYDSISIIGTSCPYNVIGPVVLRDPPIPPPPGVTPQRYCQFESPVAAIATGSQLLWYGVGIAGGTFAPIPRTDTPGIIYYYITQTVAGCVSDSAKDSVTIYPKPVRPLTVDTTYCQNAPAVQLVATGDSIKWYHAATGGTRLLPTPVPPTNVPGTDVWYASQTINGCEGDRAPEKVTILYLPVFSILPSSPWVCQHDSITLAYDGPVLIDPAYTWTLPDGGILVHKTYTVDSLIMMQFNSQLKNVTVKLRASDYGGRCFTDTSIQIKVVPQPAASSATRQDVCISDTVDLALAIKTDNAMKFTWRVDNGTLMANSSALNIVAHNSNSAGPFSISWNDSGLHVIQLNCTTEEGCQSEPSYDSVFVHQAPDASFTYTTRQGALCLEDSVLFTATSNKYNYSYLWSPAHFFNNINKPSAWGKVEQTRSIVTLTVTDPFGCVSTENRELDPSTCCTVSFPTAFTPNGDGKNDVFRPIFTGFHRFHAFRIANRWGQVIFQSNDSRPEWDGTYNGVPQDMDAYFYYIKYDCGGRTIEESGTVTLVR
jgi:gliding motility-associated-like protein